MDTSRLDHHGIGPRGATPRRFTSATTTTHRNAWSSWRLEPDHAAKRSIATGSRREPQRRGLSAKTPASRPAALAGASRLSRLYSVMRVAVPADAVACRRSGRGSPRGPDRARCRHKRARGRSRSRSSGALQVAGGVAGLVQHAIVGMEGGEVQREVAAKSVAIQRVRSSISSSNRSRRE